MFDGVYELDIKCLNACAAGGHLKYSAVPRLLIVWSEALQKPVGAGDLISGGHAHPCPLIVSCVHVHPHDKLLKAPAENDI